MPGLVAHRPHTHTHTQKAFILMLQSPQSLTLELDFKNEGGEIKNVFKYSFIFQSYRSETATCSFSDTLSEPEP